MLYGMEFEVGAGELVTLGERNGAGKTRMLRAIIGIIEPAHRLCPLRRPRVDPTQLQPVARFGRSAAGAGSPRH